jgi:myo-inositol-1(or 4)-monophosphatase
MQLGSQFIQEIIASVDEVILSKRDSINQRSLKFNAKADNSIVTELDILVSQKIQRIARKYFPHANYIDEEVESCLSFPAIIVDPIDGTKELNQGISECAVSIAYMNSSQIDDAANFALIYNPLNNFTLHSFQLKSMIGSSYFKYVRVMISRTEWAKMHLENTDDLHFIPIGSIAYKLGLLAHGMFEAVISYREKNIWDIAAGCVLVSQAGGGMFNQQNIMQNSLDSISIKGPLIWVRDPEILNKLKGI